MPFVVYMHTSPSGKRYVGVTSQRGNSRWFKHVSDANRGSNTAFHRAIRKYGAKSFATEVLERMHTEAGAKHAERLWIAELGTVTPVGYNISHGGDGWSGPRAPFTDEHKAKLSLAHKGKSPTVETRRAMSEAQKKAYARDPSRRKKVSVNSKLPKTDATREKMSGSQRRVAAARTPDERTARASNAAKAQWANNREAMRAAHRGKTVSAETCARLSETTKNSWIARRAKMAGGA